MKYNYQRDPQWDDEIMTQADIKTDPEGRRWVDHIWQYGCLITALANIVQIFIKKPFTPKDLNDMLKISEGYNYLHDKSITENQASFIYWPAFQNLFRIVNIQLNQTIDKYQYRENCFYVARIIMEGQGHYVNIIAKSGSFFSIYDTWDDRVKLLKPEEITLIHSFTWG